MADFHHLMAPMAHGGVPLKQDKDPQKAPKRNNIGIACTSCKKRKLKCSGESPCQNCNKSNRDCTVDRASDKRRRGGIKRKLETLEDRKDLLLNLVAMLRDSGDRSVLQLLDFIRSNASLAEVKSYLDEQHQVLHANKSDCNKKSSQVFGALDDFINDHNNNGTDGNGNGDEVQHLDQPESPLNGRNNANILDAAQLQADIPRLDVPARPWTTVTADARFVSQLVSLWLTWFHPFCNWLDRDLFLQDMRSEDLQARFCSPFLVNAMLAVACTHSNHQNVFAVPGNMASKGGHFYQEAKRLLDNEQGRITLTTVQGLGLLTIYAGLACKDRHGWIHGNHLAYAAQELSRQCPPSSPTPVVDHTIWGVFNVATTKAFAYHKMPPIEPPHRPVPPLPHHGEHDTWHPYPMQLDGIQAHTGCLFHALCELNRIAYDVARVFFGGGNQRHHPVPCPEPDELCAQLQRWVWQLPVCLKEPESTQVPHLLSLHMYYYTICIALNQHAPSIKHEPDPDKHGLAPPSLFFARKISHLAHIHRSSWGIDRIPVSNIFWITTALLTLLPNLTDPENRDAFVNLAVASKAFSRRWVLGRSNLGLVQRRAREMQVDLPDETGPLFLNLESISPRKRLKV